MEIKIRVWFPKLNKMVYLHAPENDWDTADFPIVLSFDGGRPLVLDFEAGINRDYEGAVIMLFTGKKDKNGKDSYDGDICLCPTTYVPNGTFFIRWQGSGFTMSPNVDGECRESFWFQSFEVIGNIYQNRQNNENI